MTLKAEREAEKQEALARLREMLLPGDTVRTILRHVSRSGMQRSISLVVADRADGCMTIDYWVSKVLGNKFDQSNGGLKISGCGMDMGFSLVYSLSRALFPDGYQCTGERCPGNDHHNPPHPKRDGRIWHNDGGYALEQRWL